MKATIVFRVNTNSTQCMGKNAGQLLGSTDRDAAALRTLSLPSEECHIKCTS